MVMLYSVVQYLSQLYLLTKNQSSRKSIQKIYLEQCAVDVNFKPLK